MFDEASIMAWIQELLYVLPGLLLGFSLHEYCHARVAYACGDESQKSLGRLTLNPVKQIDPMGFLCMIIFRFGWARPVQVNHRALKKPKRDYLFVSLAGPVSNFLLAVVMSLPTAGCYAAMVLNPELQYNTLLTSAYAVCYCAMNINFLLFFFNMLPIPGFDGYHAITCLLPARVNEFLYRFERYGFFILLLLVVFPGPLAYLQYAIDAVIHWSMNLWLSLITVFL